MPTPTNEAWDWPNMYYTGTVALRMSPMCFWKTTPKKLNSLDRIHWERVNNQRQAKEEQQFIDQIF